MTAVALMGRETSRIELGTAVVPLQSRHPVALGPTGAVGAGRVWRSVQSRRRAVAPLDRRHHARTALRAPGEGRRGLSRRVRRHVRRDRARSTSRTTASASTTRSTSPTSRRLPVLLAALGPVMLRIAGERTDGTVLWMADERAIAEHVVPADHEGGRERGPAGASRRCRRTGVRCARPTRSTRPANGRTASSATPSSRRTTSGCSSRVTPPTSATSRRSARKPTSSDGFGRLPTRAPPTSRYGSCPSARDATSCSRRPAGRASSWPRSRPRSRERTSVSGHEGRSALEIHSRDGRVDAATRFGDAEAVVDGGRRVTFTELVADFRRVDRRADGVGHRAGRARRHLGTEPLRVAGRRARHARRRRRGRSGEHPVQGERGAITSSSAAARASSSRSGSSSAWTTPRRSPTFELASRTSRSSSASTTPSAVDHSLDAFRQLGESVDDRHGRRAHRRGADLTTSATCCSRRARPVRRRAC